MPSLEFQQGTDDKMIKASMFKSLFESEITKTEFQTKILPYFGLNVFFTSIIWNYFTREWAEEIKNRNIIMNEISKGKRDESISLDTRNVLSYERFAKKWEKLSKLTDVSEKIFEIMKANPKMKQLSGQSFELIVSDVLNHHLDLAFLKGNTIFQKRYSNFLLFIKLKLLLRESFIQSEKLFHQWVNIWILVNSRH